MKLTEKKLEQFKKLNENGFTINFYSTTFSDYPALEQLILENEAKQYTAEVKFLKYYNKTGCYSLKIKEYVKSKNSKLVSHTSSENLEIKLIENKTEKGIKYSFKELISLCHKYTKDQLLSELNKKLEVTSK